METDAIFTEKLICGAAEHGVSLSAGQAVKFAEYKELLLEWNKKMNLTAITDDDGILVKHFLDSLSVAPFLPLTKNGLYIADVGSGAGFPGIPLKIALDETELLLIDSLNKRINFLREVITVLELSGATAVHMRAEEAGRNPLCRERFDVCVSRAVAALPLLAEYCLPLVKNGGIFIAMKGPSADGEITEAGAAIKAQGGEIFEIRKITLPFSDIARSIILIKKIRHVPAKSPIKKGLTAKKQANKDERRRKNK